MNFAYEHLYFFCVLEMESITFVLCICSVYLNLIWIFGVSHSDTKLSNVKCQSLIDNIVIG